MYQGKRIHKELAFEEPIKALDQDMGVGAPVRYELISGNDRRLFYLNPINGTLFLEKEIDLDSETSLPGKTYIFGPNEAFLFFLRLKETCLFSFWFQETHLCCKSKRLK